MKNEYIAYKGIRIELFDGEWVENVDENEFGIKTHFEESDGYTVVYADVASNQKVRKINFVFEFNLPKAENALVHSFLNSAIKPVSECDVVQDNKYFFSLFDNDGKGLTFCNKIPSRFDSNIIFHKDETKKVELQTVIPYSFEGSFATEKFIISPYTDYVSALKYSTESSAIKKEWEDVIGWGSWDYYYTSIDEEAVKENTDFIANDEFLSSKIKYIAIDDGWQQAKGDWKEGCRFRNGLKETADYIRNKGFEAGIWTAPTELHPLCGTVMRRNGFLVRNSYGDPIEHDANCVLDPTHPDGEKFIREIYTYLRECGYTFYKIDFIGNIIHCDRFYDSNCGHFDVLKRLIEIIRDCVGDESHIMGCSLPYAYGGEGIDSRRTSLDIHNTWKHIKKCSEIHFPQFAAQRTIYQNDLDYLVVRGEDTSIEEKTTVLNYRENEYLANPIEEFRWREAGEFSYNEAKFWCTTLLLSGSSLFLSDRMTMLNEKGLFLVKKTLECADFVGAKPIVTDGGFPEIWRKENWMYVLNYDKGEKSYTIKDVENGAYYDIFTDTEYVAENGTLCVVVDGHDSLALKKK